MPVVYATAAAISILSRVRDGRVWVPGILLWVQMMNQCSYEPQLHCCPGEQALPFSTHVHTVGLTLGH